jgi:hypothetical protein
MPEPNGRGTREFLPSANQALAALEETTGKPVMIVDAPELNVLATIRRAGPEDSSHVLRRKRWCSSPAIPLRYAPWASCS